MNKILLKYCRIFFIIFIMVTLTGCQPNDYTEEGALAQIEKYYKDFKDSEEYKQFKEAWNLVKQVKIITAKMNQSTVLRAIKYDYLLNGKLPSNKEQVEELIDKPLEEMRLDVRLNNKGLMEIFSIDPELTKEQVPDVVVDPNKF